VRDLRKELAPWPPVPRGYRSEPMPAEPGPEKYVCRLPSAASTGRREADLPESKAE